ncbi:MAG: hypothetical protein KAS84_05670 [Anaerolineales bacterium]|nr:hypothetical protein [Anaerolineales bacterium]
MREKLIHVYTSRFSPLKISLEVGDIFRTQPAARERLARFLCKKRLHELWWKEKERVFLELV